MTPQNFDEEITLSLENPEYDVAISFLASDEAIASELDRHLSESLSVFFFPKKQEELAGTDGMETMRTPFTDDSRVMLVLYRERWGKTRWTAIEEIAVKDACFNGGWERLFFVALDRTSILPKWLPEMYVRYNWEDFGADQVVGIIKSRVLKNGGIFHPITALKLAENYQKDEDFKRARASIFYNPGIKAIQELISQLFSMLKAKIDDIATQGHMNAFCEFVLEERNADQGCTITDLSVSVTATWHRPFNNSLDSSGLIVREFNSEIILPSEVGKKRYWEMPEARREIKHRLDISRTRELGWSLEKSDDFIPNADLAEKIVIRFIELAARQSNRRNKS